MNGSNEDLSFSPSTLKLVQGTSHVQASRGTNSMRSASLSCAGRNPKDIGPRRRNPSSLIVWSGFLLILTPVYSAKISCSTANTLGDIGILFPELHLIRCLPTIQPLRRLLV